MPVAIFLFAGFSAVVVQSLFIREMLVIFQGNELSLGIIFSDWLIGAALGNFSLQGSNSRKAEGFTLSISSPARRSL